MNNRLERLINLLGEDNVSKLNNAKVAVVGLGGVGGEAVIALARSGVGTLIIQDFDIVNESNFNRQIIANMHSLGYPKVEVTKEMILGINPDCNVITINEVYDKNSSLFTHEFSYLIDCIDSVDNKVDLIIECLKRKKVFISSMGTAKKLDIKKLDILDIGKTSYDPLARVIRKKLRDKEIYDSFKTLSSTEEPQKIDSLGSYIGVTASAGIMIADYIIKKIIEK